MRLRARPGGLVKLAASPNSKNDAVARGTTLAISDHARVFYQILLMLRNWATRAEKTATALLQIACDYGADEILMKDGKMFCGSQWAIALSPP